MGRRRGRWRWRISQDPGRAGRERHAASSRPPLAISVMAGGTVGTRPWKETIRTISRRVAAIGSEYHAPLALHVVFQIPGEVLRPDFTGVRTGAFSRRAMSLVLQAAVPDAGAQDREAWVLATLREAVDAAERFVVMEALPD